MTEANTLLRIDSLKLRNFRCFSECEVLLHPELTVIVAENGYGKTATLDAIGGALKLFVNTITGISQYYGGFDRNDVRVAPNADGVMVPSQVTSFEASGFVSGERMQWMREVFGNGRHARTTTKRAEGLRRAARLFREDPERGTPDQLTFPLIAFYGTGRLWSEHRLTKSKKSHFIDPKDRASGYIDCLSSSSSFQGLVAWYESKMSELGDARFATDIPRTMPLVQAVQQATRTVLNPTGWSELDWDNDNRCLMVRHELHGRLPLSAMSDGVQSMIALIADVARRCASLNPHLGAEAASQTPGILLIDEIDMHLHPRWQQLVIQLLRQAFPALQLVVSTHSPHVLSTVDKGSIRAIDIADGHGTFTTPALQTRGVESADVLASIMGVNPVPQVEEARWLYDYRALIETGAHETQDAQRLRSDLIRHFGDRHPVMLDCDRLIRFQAFKRRQSQADKD